MDETVTRYRVGMDDIRPPHCTPGCSFASVINGNTWCCVCGPEVVMTPITYGRRDGDQPRTSRLTVKAAFRNGGKALVHLQEGASHEEAAREVEHYLNRGATLVTVERQDRPPEEVSKKTRNGG